MNKCGHDDCFTCPYPDCIETASGINSVKLIEELRPSPERKDKDRKKGDKSARNKM